MEEYLIKDGEITASITKYITETQHDPYHRYTSWDNCRSAFLSQEENNYHTLELAFYLASWGMYRGSSGLLQKNHLIHGESVKIFFSGKYERLKCTVDQEISIKELSLILELQTDLCAAYSSIKFIRGTKSEKPISPTDTLVTKIMLGTFSCIPAFDNFFLLGLKTKKIKTRIFNEQSFRTLLSFAERHRSEIQHCQKLILESSGRHYPIMKIIDMFFWQIGYEEDLKKVLSKNL